jgi:RNAse (barnase) inhibitor barstar
MSRTVCTLDDTRFDTLEGFYEEVSQRLTPGMAYARNLDALDDILWGGFGTPDDGFILVWKNSDRSRAVLGYDETIGQLQKRLERCHPLSRRHVERELGAAKRRVGPTVFDWLVEIFHDHENIELRLE